MKPQGANKFTKLPVNEEKATAAPKSIRVGKARSTRPKKEFNKSLQMDYQKTEMMKVLRGKIKNNDVNNIIQRERLIEIP